MSSKGYLAVWAGSALLATGILAGCDAGNQQQQDPGSPATQDSGSDNMAMYEPEGADPAADPTTADDPYATTDPAQDPMMGSDRSSQSQGGQSLDSMSPDQIVGMTVVSREGEEIGDVQEVVTDQTSGQKFVVVDVGGFLGVGQKSIVIGFDELQASGQASGQTSGQTSSGQTSGDQRLQSDLTRESLQTQTEYSPEDYETLSGSGQQTTQ